MLIIEEVYDIPFPAFEELKQESLREGFRFVERLEREWLGTNPQFSQKGECFYKVTRQEQLIGIGGITRCPYSNKIGTGRLRRFYILPLWRRQGIGRLLVQHILHLARPHFQEIVLYTDQVIAGAFYESLGFAAISGQRKVSHTIILGKEGHE